MTVLIVQSVGVLKLLPSGISTTVIDHSRQSRGYCRSQNVIESSAVIPCLFRIFDSFYAPINQERTEVYETFLDEYFRSGINWQSRSKNS